MRNIKILPSCCSANLSHDYFTNRQDRYFLLTDVQELANFLHDIVAAVSRHSLQLQDGNTCVLHPAALQHPFLVSTDRLMRSSRTFSYSLEELEAKQILDQIQTKNQNAYFFLVPSALR